MTDPGEELIAYFKLAAVNGQADRLNRLLQLLVEHVSENGCETDVPSIVIERLCRFIDLHSHKAMPPGELAPYLAQLTSKLTLFLASCLKQDYQFGSLDADRLFRLNKLLLHSGYGQHLQEFRDVFWCGVGTGQIPLAEQEKKIGLSKARQKKPKVAVIVAGQIRAWRKAAESLVPLISGADARVFMATWDKSGYRPQAGKKFKEQNRAYYKMIMSGSFADFLVDEGLDAEEVLSIMPGVRDQLVGEVNADEIKAGFGAEMFEVHSEDVFNSKYNSIANDLEAKFPRELSENSVANPLNMFKLVYLREKANDLSRDFVGHTGESFDYKLFVRPDYIHASDYPLADIIADYRLADNEILIDAMHPDSLFIFSDCFALGRASAMDQYFDQWKNFMSPDLTSGRVSCPVKPHDRIAEHLWREGLATRFIRGVRHRRDEVTKITDEEISYQIHRLLDAADSQPVRSERADTINILKKFVERSGETKAASV